MAFAVKINPFFEPIIASLQRLHGQIYLVGGAVRDACLHKTSHDLDFVVDGDAIKAARTAADAGEGAFFVLDSKRGYGRAVFRIDGQSLHMMDFAPFAGGSLAADLKARDFTINAMAVDINALDSLIDPLHGRQDLENKVLKLCSDTSFRDDPIRTLRAVRFMVELHMQISKKTRALLDECVAGLQDISQERKRDELFKILDNPHVIKAMRLMQELGLLPRVLPELVPLIGLYQPPPHAVDAWQHTLTVVDICEKMVAWILNGTWEDSDPYLQSAGQVLAPFRTDLQTYFSKRLTAERSLRALLLLAALYHDVGKTRSKLVGSGGRHEFVEHDLIGAKITEKRMVNLALSNPEVACITRIVRHHMALHYIPACRDSADKRNAIFHYFKETGEVGILTALFALADLRVAHGKNLSDERWQRALNACQMVLDGWFRHYREWIDPPLYLKGNDLIRDFGMRQGPLIGRYLDALREAQAVGDVTEKAQAQEFIQTLIKEGNQGE